MLSLPTNRSAGRSAGIVCASLGFASVVCWVFRLFIHPGTPYLIFLAAVGVVAWTNGFRATLITFALGYVLANLFFLEPRFTLHLSYPPDWFDTLGYVVIGLRLALFAKRQEAVAA